MAPSRAQPTWQKAGGKGFKLVFAVSNLMTDVTLAAPQSKRGAP